MKWIVLGLFIASVLYIHLRGHVRHKFWRQMSDHSSFMAPINVFMYALSKVPTTPYVSTDPFPELQVLQQNWQMIRDEAINLREAGRIRAAEQFNDAGFNSFFKFGWKRFYLKWYDASHPSALAHCPRTTALLRTIPTVKAAMFAELPPGGRLTKHRDPYAGSPRFHLGLLTPNDERCFINVDGERYHWRDGEGVMFDETYIHFAENRTEHDRIILFCDVERPMKYRWAQVVNQFIARHLLASATSPNMDGDQTGGFNKAFKYLYSVRLVGKRLKERNVQAYYAVKWSLFGGIAVGLSLLI